jgi:hypothetical protein
MFVDAAFRRHLNNELVPRACENALKAAANPEEHRSAIREAFRRFGFTHAKLRLSGHRFQEALVAVNGNPTWNVDIPLRGRTPAADKVFRASTGARCAGAVCGTLAQESLCQ